MRTKQDLYTPHPEAVCYTTANEPIPTTMQLALSEAALITIPRINRRLRRQHAAAVRQAKPASGER